MKLSTQVKPISYLKAHAAEIIRGLGEGEEALVITQNGEAKAVIQARPARPKQPRVLACPGRALSTYYRNIYRTLR